MDRSTLSRHLATALAYLACGKIAAANDAAQRLVNALRALGLDIR